MARQRTARLEAASTLSPFSRRLAQSARQRRDALTLPTSNAGRFSTSTNLPSPRAQPCNVTEDMFLLALKPLPLWTPFSPSLRHRLSPFETKCRHCDAQHWIEERTSSSSVTAPEFSKCCKCGSVKLADLLNPPEPLLSYYRGTSAGTHPSTS
jgi:hypothetical protein